MEGQVSAHDGSGQGSGGVDPKFYELLGLKETRRWDNEGGRFTLVFMAPEGQEECPVELTYNWDGDEGLPSDSRHFGHLAYRVENIYEMCQHLMDNGVVINRPPRDGHMAFVRSPDNVSIELLQDGDAWPRLSPGPAWKTRAIGKAGGHIGRFHRGHTGAGAVSPGPGLGVGCIVVGG